MTIKHLHMALALASISLFVTRACWSIKWPQKLGQRWVKITPHIVDTLLLICGIYLATQLSAWQQPWLQTKLAALVLYIGLGVMTFRGTKTPALRTSYAILAVGVFLYMVAVATTKNPSPFS